MCKSLNVPRDAAVQCAIMKPAEKENEKTNLPISKKVRILSQVFVITERKGKYARPEEAEVKQNVYLN